MNHWLILGLAIVAMVATVVVFMWWWTTDNWDWASAELKPPRTVRLSLETAAEFAEVWTVADCQLQILELKQRVTALEEMKIGTALLGMWQRLGRLEEATLSHPTASHTTDCPSDAAEQESIPPESLASSRSDQRIIVGGRVGRALKSADPPDAS